MTKSPSRTPTRKQAANATKGTPKLTKREKEYKSALAMVAMTKNPELMSPKASKEYQKAKNLIVEHEAYVAAVNRGSVPFAMDQNAVTSPRRKKTVVTHDSNLAKKSTENCVLSPPNHKYPGMSQKAVQHYGSASKTIAFDMTMAHYGEEGFEEGFDNEEEMEVFHSARKMASPKFHVASKTHHGHEPKALFHERYPNKAAIDQDWEEWKDLTMTIAKQNPKVVLIIIAIFCFLNVSWFSLFLSVLARLFF